MGTWIEKFVGVLLAVMAILWAAYHMASVRGFEAAYLRLGPMQVLMGGILMWLHGRFRAARFTHARRDYQTRFREF
jgi:hypothetical protein